LKVLADDVAVFVAAGAFADAAAPGSEQAESASRLVAARARPTAGLSAPVRDLRD
jgi:hypothetical protein